MTRGPFFLVFATTTSSLHQSNIIKTMATRALTGPELLVARDILPDGWWRKGGLAFYASRCAAHFGSIPTKFEDTAKGQTLSQALDCAWLQKPGEMSDMATAWLKASHRCLIGEPNLRCFAIIILIPPLGKTLQRMKKAIRKCSAENMRASWAMLLPWK